MVNKVIAFVILCVVASLIWLFAEAESLGEASLSEVNVRFGSSSTDRLVSPPPDWRGRVSLDLRGSRQAIEEVRQALVRGVRLTPGLSGVPDGSGTVDLLAAMRNVPEIRETGVEITSVTPIRTEITVLDLETVEVAVRADLGSVRTTGNVEIDPPTARLQLPEAIRAELGDSLEIQFVPDEGELEALPESGPATISGRLQLPGALRGQRGVSILSPQPPVAQVSFTVFSTIATQRIDIVPVQVSMPSIELNDWRVTLSAENAAISATITGPRAIVDEIADEASGRRLVSILYLRSDELNIGITSKAVSFGLIASDGTLAPLPPGLGVTPSTDAVRFTIERASEPVSAGGE